MTFLNLIKETYSILEAPQPPEDAAMPQDAQQNQTPAQPEMSLDPDQVKKQFDGQMKLLGVILKTTFLILDKGSTEIKNDTLKEFISRMKEASDSVDFDVPKALDEFNSILETESSKFGVNYNLNDLKPD